MLRISPFRVPITRLIICVFCGAWRGDYKSSKNPATALQAEMGGRWRGRRETKTCLVHRPLWSFVLAHDNSRPAEMHRSGFWVPFATKRYNKNIMAQHRSVRDTSAASISEKFLVQLFIKGCKTKDSTPKERVFLIFNRTFRRLTLDVRPPKITPASRGAGSRGPRARCRAPRLWSGCCAP